MSHFVIESDLISCNIHKDWIRARNDLSQRESRFRWLACRRRYQRGHIDGGGRAYKDSSRITYYQPDKGDMPRILFPFYCQCKAIRNCVALLVPCLVSRWCDEFTTKPRNCWLKHCRHNFQCHLENKLLPGPTDIHGYIDNQSETRPR